MSEWQKTVQKRTSLEFCIVRVDDSYRITLPKPFCNRVGWIGGDKPHNAWLLVADPGRCRLLSEVEVEGDPSFQSLLDRIPAELKAINTNPLEFQDAASVALAFRLLPVEIMPRGSGWRLALPDPLAAVMEVRLKETDVAAMLLGDHIEIWTIETLRSSLAVPLTRL